MQKVKINQETFDLAVEKGFPLYKSIFHRLFNIVEIPHQLKVHKWLINEYDIHVMKQQFQSYRYNKISYRAFVVTVPDGKVIKSKKTGSFQEAFEDGLQLALNLI
jgi:hypothetical protein